jgi:hypothetical protein
MAAATRASHYLARDRDTLCERVLTGNKNRANKNQWQDNFPHLHSTIITQV